MTTVEGDVVRGFEPVRDAFEENFRLRGEVGAACAAYHRGEKVVDLWGGHRDHERRLAWQAETMVPVFSTSKGVCGLVVAAAVSRGQFSYDDSVSEHWVEFGAHGKDRVTVRELLAHQAGLSAIDHELDEEIIGDSEKLSSVLATQRPSWEPGVRQGYHSWTLGWYESELVRRTDPRGRSLGRYLAGEIGSRFDDFRFFIGLPDSVQDDEVAELRSFSRWEMVRTIPPALVVSFLNPRSIVSRSMANPRFLMDHLSLNGRPVRALEIGSANGIGTARSLAALFGDAATGGELLEIDERVLAALEAPAQPPTGSHRDLVLKRPITFSLGMMKPSPYFAFGTDGRAYGHWGAGGSCAFADPATGSGFAYVMNQMGGGLFGDDREAEVRNAYFSALRSSGDRY